MDVDDEVDSGDDGLCFLNFSAYYAAAPAAKSPETIESSVLSNSRGDHSTRAAPAPVKEERGKTPE